MTEGFAGPLAAAWPQLRRTLAEGVLAPPGNSLPVPPATDRSTWAEPAVDAATLAALRATADAERGTPWPQPLAHQYARYHRDGDRDGYEQLVFARQHRLSRAAVLAAVTLEPAWIDEAADGIVLLCEQSSWCWPAHDDTFRRHGAVLPDVTDPCLDLGAGEVAAQLAWIDQLLGGPLDDRVPGLRARVRHEVGQRVLAPFTARRDWHWIGLDGDVHNWNPWIHGNVLVAALRLVDDVPRRALLAGLVVEGLDRYVAALPADGAIDEGYAYWWNGACRLLEALDLLAHASGGALDVPAIPALTATVAFPQRMHLGGAWYLNHADGQARPPADQPWAALHRAARRAGDADALAHAAAHRRPGTPLATESAGLGRLLRALTDPDWLAAGAAGSPLPRDVRFGSTQVLIARPAAGRPAGLTLAVKGGHNGEHHNHNDVGSVVVALNGTPVVADAGRPTYTAQTFGPGRYALWPMQSDWHSVPQIRGTAQAPGARYAARDVRMTVADGGSEFRLDLAPAYPRGDVRHWRRTARLDRATGEVTLTDSWHLDGAGTGGPGTGDDPGDGRTRVHLVLAGEVTVRPGTAEITAREGAGTLVICWDPAGAPATTTVRTLDDPMLTGVWGDRLTRLEIDVSARGPVGTLELTMKEHR